MQVVITAVGRDNRGLADPIVHSVTNLGANIAEIQMFNHDAESVFSMLTRIELEAHRFAELKSEMQVVADRTKLAIRTWSPDIVGRRPRLAICVTYRPETPRAVLQAVRDSTIAADVGLMISNRDVCRSLADEFGIPWYNIADTNGVPDDEKMISLCDEFEVDFVILARYMRVLPAASCWKYSGGRIINLHHGLLPSFPGMNPYRDAYANRMLTFGATCHFIVPELDAGNQIIYQSTFAVPPGAVLEEIVARGQQVNEPACLVEGVRRVVADEVRLHFNRVVVQSRSTGVTAETVAGPSDSTPRSRDTKMMEHISNDHRPARIGI